MKVLIDTNVALTYVSGREDPFVHEVDVIMRKCAEEEIDGAIALHSLSIIWYQARKLPDDMRREWIRQICELLTVSYADNEVILGAIDNIEFKDFEDALQDCCASSFHADYIITANIKDFKGVSSVPALTPKEFLDLINASDDTLTTKK